MTTKICRLCLKTEGEFFELFDETETGNVKLVDEVNEILNIQIIHDERLPSAICANCFKIQSFFKEFRLSCLKVTNYLIGQLDATDPVIVGNCQKLRGPLVKVEKMCYQSAEDQKKNKSLGLKTENTVKGNCMSVEEHESSELNFSNLKRSESVETMKLVSFSESDWIGNEECNTQAVEEIPPLVRIVTDEEATKCSVIESLPLNSENIIASEQLYDSSTSHKFILPEANAQNCVEEEEVLLEDSDTQDSCEETSPDICILKNDAEINSTERFLHTPEKSFPLNSPEVMAKVGNSPISEDKIVRESLESNNETAVDPIGFTSPIVDDYELKHEEVILTESPCDEESEIGDIDQLDDLLVQEEIELPTCKAVILTSKSTPIMEEIIISNPNKIRSCGIEFSKATANMLLNMQEAGVKLSPAVIKETALKVAATHGLSQFSASTGWLISFYKRFDIDLRFGEIKIPTSHETKTLSNRFIIRYCCEELNEATFEACCDILSKGVELSGNIIKDIASKIAVREGLLEFSATVGWLNSFKKKYNICLRGQKNPLKHMSL